MAPLLDPSLEPVPPLAPLAIILKPQKYDFEASITVIWDGSRKQENW
jgi:hypothetical protein